MNKGNKKNNAFKKERLWEATIEGILYACRWLLLPLFLGLACLVLLLTWQFYAVLIDTALHIHEIGKKPLIVIVLTLVDMCLIASLVIMVAISGYENFVSRITVMEETEKPTIFSRLDPGTIKIKLGMVIIAIASIQLLQTLTDIKSYTQEEVYLQIALQIALILAGGMMGLIDIILSKKHGHAKH